MDECLIECVPVCLDRSGGLPWIPGSWSFPSQMWTHRKGAGNLASTCLIKLPGPVWAERWLTLEQFHAWYSEANKTEYFLCFSYSLPVSGAFWAGKVVIVKLKTKVKNEIGKHRAGMEANMMQGAVPVCGVAMRFLHEGSPWDLRIGWKTCIQVLRQMLALGLNSKRCMEYDPAWGPHLMLRWCRGTLTSWFWLVSTWDQAQWSQLKENFHGSLFYRTGQRGASLIKAKGGCALPPNPSLKPSFNQRHEPSLRDHDANSGTRKSFPRYNCAS